MQRIEIHLPAVNAQLHAHNKGGWRAKAGPTRKLRALAADLASWQMMSQGIKRGQWSTAVVDYYFVVPDRRRRDIVNMLQSQKAAIDGVCLGAGLLPDDDWQHLALGRVSVAIAKPPKVVMVFTQTSKKE